tara:strand:- start:1829 stop:2713 length:885 start_codon:yes stop_codon:yes gene_type:complete
MAVHDLQWNIGSHVQWNKTFENTISFAIKNGMYAFQVFMGNPKSFNRSVISKEDIDKAKKLLERFPTFVFTHSPYLYNLAGSKDILAWNGDTDQDNKTLNVIKSLEYELNIVSNFNIKGNGVILHPGNHIDRHKGLLTIAKSISMINFDENAKLLLENTAGQGTSLGTTFKELKTIYDNVVSEKQKYIGICVDTAHIFGYGEYDISKVSEVERMFTEFTDLFDISMLKLIHLNDSKVPLKSRKDRHELIGEGLIWGKNMDSLFYLLEYCKVNNIPLVLETNPSDMHKFFNLSKK